MLGVDGSEWPVAGRQADGGSAGNRTRCRNPAAETLKLTTRNNAKVRETTCGYAKRVDGVNTPHLSPRAGICLPRIAKPAPPVVMDERTADTFRLDAGPVEELKFGRSIVCCLRDGCRAGIASSLRPRCG